MFRFLKDFLFEEDLVPVAEPHTSSVESIGANASKLDEITNEKPAGGPSATFSNRGISVDDFPDDKPAKTPPAQEGLMLDLAAPSKETEPDIPLAGEAIEFGDLSKSTSSPEPASAEPAALNIPVEETLPDMPAEPVEIKIATSSEPDKIETPAPETPEPEPIKEEPAAPEPTPEPESSHSFSVDKPASPMSSVEEDTSDNDEKLEKDLAATKAEALELVEKNNKEIAELKQNSEKLDLQIASLEKSNEKIVKQIIPEIDRIEAARKLRLENAAKLEAEQKNEEQAVAKLEEQLDTIETIDKLAA